MDFDKLLYEYDSKKNKNNRLKDINKAIKGRKIFFGSGGSDNIIIKYNDISVLKIIPNFKKDPNTIQKMDNDQKEIQFYKFFTKYFILKNVTPHIVGYYENYKLTDIETIFPKKCLTIDEKLTINPSKIDYIDDTLCSLKHKYEHGMINKMADIIVLENCPNSIERYVSQTLSIKKLNHKVFFEIFLDRIIFQLLFTLTAIQNKYPNFIHNDLFLRNILGKYVSEYDEHDYVEYIYDNVSYYFPANGFHIKINDFGYSLMPPVIVSDTLYKQLKFDVTHLMSYNDNLRDVFTFLYDLYNGQNYGHASIMNIVNGSNISDKKSIIKYIRKIFKKYIDVDVIDSISKKNKHVLDHVWNIKDVPILRNTVMEPKKYFINNIFKKYIVLPDNSTVVNTYLIK